VSSGVATSGGRWAAPGRVNLIGEHVDYAEGLCLPFAIAERTVVAAQARSDERLVVHSDAADDGRPPDVEIALDAIGPGSPAGWAGYVAGVLWALREAGHAVGGVSVRVADTVPLGAGLSSSAALECAVALAVNDLYALGLDRAELARACVRAENDVVGAATGGMDQTASMFGEEGHALLVDMRDGSKRPVPFAPADDGLRLLVIDTRVRHHLADGQYGQRRAAVEKAAEVLGLRSLREATQRDLERLDGELLRRARHIVTEIARVREVVALLQIGRTAAIGPLLDASHTSLARDYEVSCPELDLACEVARGSGAFGARMTGGGFGGSAIALVPFSRVEDVTRSVPNAFAAQGYRSPVVREAVPSAGAGPA
jgi:galactokinase